MLKKIFSYLIPITIFKQKSTISSTIEVTWVNGELVLDSNNTNYSYGSLQRILKKGLQKIGFEKIKSMNHILVLGVAGGSVIKTLLNDVKYNGKITGVEIDPEIISIANTYFQLHETPNLTIIIDEWSAIPLDIQPYLAEFLKKSFIPIPEVVLKIGALEYRSNFTIPRDKHNYIGFELGSDISTNLDIDDYFVYDRNPKEITKTFSEILFKHLKSELPDNYFSDIYHINTINQFIQGLFTGMPAFDELVRASEGVIRDFINIFSLAFFDTQRKTLKKIDKKIVLEASRQWFENDKAKNLDNQLHDKIRLIIDEVIGKRRARSFLVSRELEQNPIIQKLFDARVIHVVKKGYSDKDNPGVRYNIYSLDYGTYVDLINTSKQPQIEFEFMEEQTEEFIVPFDDKRSIRRIILTKEILDE